MEKYVMMLDTNDERQLQMIKGSYVAKGVMTHRDIENEGKWRLTDVKTGCNFGGIFKTKKQAVAAYSEELEPKLLEYRTTKEYKERRKLYMTMERELQVE